MPELYGVTSELVLETVGFADVSEQSRARPGPTVVTKWISRFAAQLAVRHAGAGTDEAPESDSDEYLFRQQLLISRVAGEWHINSKRGATEYGLQLKAEWDAYIQELKEDTGHVTGDAGQARSESFGTNDADTQDESRYQTGWVDKRYAFD